MRFVIALLSASALWGAPSLDHVPLTFEPGARASEFITHSAGSTVTLTPAGVMIRGGNMRLLGARNNAIAQPEDLLASYSNYLIDPDPRKWRTHVPNYRRVRYRNVYPGIDVVYYGNPRQLEFDFVVSPGANPRQIRLTLDSPDLRIRLPRIYQNDHVIEGRVIRRGNRVTFDIASYDHSRPLVIDPTLSYAAVFGGGGSDAGQVIAVDSTGAAYVVGTAGDSNFPVVNGKSASGNAFVAKISPTGGALAYSTYLSSPLVSSSFGGPSTNFAIDASGNVYFASPFFTTPDGSTPPVVGPAPLAQCLAGVQAVLYVAKMSFDGTSLLYSGCIAGTANLIYTFAGPTVLAADGSGNAYIASTFSQSFPLMNPLPNPPLANSASPRAVVLKLGSNGALLYSSFVGGSNTDMVHAITADPAGNIYISGQTNSPDFPIKNAIQQQPPNAFPWFVSKIKADGSDYVYSTYLGGSNNDSVLALAADSAGKTYLAGSTTSGNFPVTSNALQKQFNGTFVYKTTDAAATWTRSDSGLPATPSFVQVDPHQPSTVYAVSSGSIFKSTDGGSTWHGTSAAGVNALWIDPVDSSLYVGTTLGDFVRSSDGGATFAGIPGALGGNLNAMAFDPTNPSVIYARWGGHGATDGVYKSTDGGDTWKPTGLVGAMTGSGPLAIDPANPLNLFAEARNQGLVKSIDGGDTWTPLGGDVTQILVGSNSTLYTVVGNIVQVLPLGGSTIQKAAPGTLGTLLIDPTNSSIWYASISAANGQGIYTTIDAGDTWQPMNTGLANPLLVTSLAIDPTTLQTLYLATSPNSDGFIAKLSPDGTALEYSTYFGGSGADVSTAIAVDPAGNSYVAGTTNSSDFPLQNAFRQPGGGFAAEFDATNNLVWSSLLGGASPSAIVLDPKGELFLTGSTSSNTFATTGALGPFLSGNLFRTTNRGAAWTGATLAASLSSVGASAVAVDPNNSSHVYALADLLYGSNDGGQTWSPLGAPIPTPYIPVPYGAPVKLLVGPLNGLTLDPSNSSTLYAGPAAGGLYRSQDAGATWSQVPALQVPIVYAIAVDPSNSSRVYAGTRQNPGDAFVMKIVP